MTSRPRRPILPASFFERHPLICARELIGAELVWGECAGLVVETEAYLSENDEACHCFVRPSTRAFLARNRPGAAYIYLNYGVHWMLNAVTKGETGSGFVLIRALQPSAGIELMRQRRGVEDFRQLCSGPGKLTQALEIMRADDERNLCTDRAHSFRPTLTHVEVVADERIGITKSAHLPWRFTLRGSEFVSRPAKRAAGLTPRAGSPT